MQKIGWEESCVHSLKIYSEKKMLTLCYSPSNFYKVKSKYFISSIVQLFSSLTKTNNQALLTNVFHLFPHVNDFAKSKGNKVSSSTELSEAAATLLLTILSLMETMLQLCLGGQQRSSFFKGYSIPVSWPHVQAQKAADELMFTRTLGM